MLFSITKHNATTYLFHEIGDNLKSVQYNNKISGSILATFLHTSLLMSPQNSGMPILISRGTHSINGLESASILSLIPFLCSVLSDDSQASVGVYGSDSIPPILNSFRSRRNSSISAPCAFASLERLLYITGAFFDLVGLFIQGM